MAKRLEHFPPGARSVVRRYDWHSWTDGSAWEITRGEDYEVTTENMRANLHTKAKQLGVKVRTAMIRTDGVEGLDFQFFDPSELTKAAGDSPSDNQSLSDVERRFRRLIGQQVERRARATREAADATNDIAVLCVEARHEGVTMARLAEWIQVLDTKTDELRSVSRQAVDTLVAAYEGRERAPRRRRIDRKRSAGGPRRSAVKREAFQ